MYIYVLIIAFSFREDTRMACYCLKGENNLDMPGKICPEILDAVLPIELLLNSKYFLFQITGIGIFGVL